MEPPKFQSVFWLCWACIVLLLIVQPAHAQVASAVDVNGYVEDMNTNVVIVLCAAFVAFCIGWIIGFGSKAHD